MPAADLTAVKAQLRIAGTANDTQLAMYLSAVTSAVESVVGPLSVQSFAEVVSTRATALLLSKRPVQSVESLVPKISTWPSFSSADVDFDPDAGTVWRKDLGTLGGIWTVNYHAGNPVVGDDIKVMQILMVQDLWESTRGGTARPGSAAADPADAMGQYELRRRVRELMRGTALGGSGIA